MAILGKDGTDLGQPAVLDLPFSREALAPYGGRVPDHTDLPDSDGEIVENCLELPQTMILSQSLGPILDRLHPDGRYMTGGNSGIYWDLLDPPLRGAISPDWYYIPGVHGSLAGGKRRRSDVMWKEIHKPKIVLEFATTDGSKERDRTPRSGKFWIYEQAVKAAYYGILNDGATHFELFERDDERYHVVPPNRRGHYPVADLGVELGIWNGRFGNLEAGWLRVWDGRGRLLPTDAEAAILQRRRTEQAKRKADEETRRADEECERADVAARRVKEEAGRADDASRRADDEARRADEAARRADALAARLRALGIDPDEVAGSA